MTQQEALFNYCLRIADNSLIIGHRLSEWCGHGPILEEDIAMTNISLDLVGQARSMYDYAAKVEGNGRTEDDLAYVREEREYRNALLCEFPNGDFAQTVARHFFFSVFCHHFYRALESSKDETLSAFATKSLKEVAYHKRHTGDWLIRLGDGTEESHQRTQNAIDTLWPYTGDMFAMDEVDAAMIDAGIGVDLEAVKTRWMADVEAVLKEATINLPEGTWMHSGSKRGIHTEHFGYILAELQYMQRAYPGCTW